MLFPERSSGPLALHSYISSRLEVRSLPDRPNRRNLSATVVSCALFVPVGLITVMLGPALPSLSARWSLNDAQAGYLVAAQFVGSLLGTLLSGHIILKLAFRWTMIVGVAVMALGVAALMSGYYFWALAAVFCYGAGIGITVPTANLLVARAAGSQRSSSLNLLNFFWSAGAVACPFLLKALHADRGTAFFLALVTGALGALILALLAVPLHPLGPETRAMPQVGFHYFRSTSALIFATMFFLYVGTESALGAWLATYAKRAGSARGSEWITVPAYFYGALLLGRLSASWVLRQLSDLSLARIASVLAAGSIVALLWSQTISGIATSSALIGLGLSTLYPIAIGLASVRFGAAAERVMGTLFAFSTLGGACVPWIVGYVSSQLGSLRTALLVPLAGCAAVAILYWNPTLKERESALS